MADIYNIKFDLNNNNMFTFSAQHSNLPRRGPHQVQPLPQLTQPPRLQSLPPLPFYIEASQPLPSTLPQFHLERQRDQLEHQVQKYLNQRNRIDQEYSKLYEEYTQLRKQYEDLKLRYREGEQLFLQMEADNIRMYHELENLRSKKQEKSRISIGLKKKDIPVVKISVPNPKAFSQESEKQSMYRQLKTASEELTHMRKLLESEKQKTEHSQAIMSKNIEQLSGEREGLKGEIHNLKEENKFLREELAKFKASSVNSQGLHSVRSKPAEPPQYQRIKTELQRIERVHKSCDVLLASKQTQIYTLRCEIDKLSKNQSQNSPQFHRTLSYTKLKPNSSFIFQKQSNGKQNFEAHTLFPQSSEKKNLEFNQGSPDYNSLLQHHLESSTRQRKNLQQFTKELIKDLLDKIEGLKGQLQRANKKAEHQNFQLQRVYQLLRDKKIQLDNCYNDLRNASRGNKTPTKEVEREDELMKSIIKGRRNLSA